MPSPSRAALVSRVVLPLPAGGPPAADAQGQRAGGGGLDQLGLLQAELPAAAPPAGVLRARPGRGPREPLAGGGRGAGGPADGRPAGPRRGAAPPSPGGTLPAPSARNNAAAGDFFQAFCSTPTYDN